MRESLKYSLLKNAKMSTPLKWQTKTEWSDSLGFSVVSKYETKYQSV